MKNIAIISLISLTSCASIIDGSTQQISLRTEPSLAASCDVVQDGQTTKVQAPTTITVARAYSPFKVFCTPLDGGKQGSVQVLSDVSNWGYGGAVLGLGVGPAVDGATGAAFEYPAEIVVKLGETTTLGKTSMNSNVEWK